MEAGAANLYEKATPQRKKSPPIIESIQPQKNEPELINKKRVRGLQNGPVCSTQILRGKTIHWSIRGSFGVSLKQQKTNARLRRLGGLCKAKTDPTERG